MEKLPFYTRFSLIVVSLCIASCQNNAPGSSGGSNTSGSLEVTGMYYSPTTGAKIFEVKQDSGGFYALIPNNGRPSSRDSFRLTDFAQLESKWQGSCGESYDLWMAQHVIGGNDWKANFKKGLINDRESFCLLTLKKGYASKEHIYSTGYCMVVGSECYVSNITRVNIEKLK